ncbi:MAG: hypothetical protein OM95_13540 [Bdellovibrio sp. ArHS]|uniref:sialidase family protein n=1 Tax=Bdellovibrio sp. ArHS TaxID=1569284 RepID=UPI000583E349|nr:sialidase family protein [Bdellovibrio sp. ArHS]KHD87608.1 MAG: hypothetical protein OM95_13540 [Bdellovibrio sp. ArHS]
MNHIILGTSRKLIVICFILLLTACSIDASLQTDLTSKIISDSDAVPVVLTLDVGSSMTIEPAGGTPPFTYKPSTSGYLDTATGQYSIPANAQVVDEILEVIDSTGKTFAVTIHRKGFREFRRIDMPQSAQDQNYITDAVWLDSGKVLTTAVGSDYEGERWATYRSSDDGGTWNRVDQFMGYHYHGESHPLAMTAKGSIVFVCGYAYAYDTTPSDPGSGWFVRRSTDEGNTWTTSDHWWEVAGSNHVCYDIAVSPTTGFIYAVGYAESTTDQFWVIRESKDDGVTWNTIYQAAPLAGGSSDIAYQVKVSPSGDLFVIGASGPSATMYFLKGTFSSGSWTWTPATSVPAVQTYGDYELRGNLQVIDDNTAYFSCRVGALGKIYRTTDGGANWAEVYSGQSFLQGMTVTASGQLIATGGNRATNPYDWKIVSSTNGTVWTPLDLDALLSPPKGPYGLTIVSHPTLNKILAIGSNKTDYQAAVAYSGDDGATWSLGSEIRFAWAFYSTVTEIIRTSPTTLYAIFDTDDMDGNSPWVVTKSLDNGLTWQDSDRFVPASNDAYVSDIIQGHDGALYAIGTKNGGAAIRRSTDGTVWNDVHSYAFPGWDYFLATNKTTATYFAGQDGANIVVGKTTDGTTWSHVKTFALPGGVHSIKPKSLEVDTAGNVYLIIMEQINFDATIVVYRSSDGGTTWSEALRGSSLPNYWEVSFALKISPTGDVYAYNGSNMFKSTDNGATWSPFSTPANVLDIGWSGTIPYFLVKDPTDGDVVVTEGFTPGTWTIIEKIDDRYTVGESIGEYGTELTEKRFYSLSSTELLLNYTYNDAYLGARTILRVLDSSQ